MYFFLHQTLVFVFYQFISVCALRGEGVHFGLTDGTGGKEGSEFGESHYPNRFIAVGQFLSKCSAPLPFAIFIVVDINKHYLLSMEDLLIDCCFSADQNKGWIN